ncbi:MAG: hypothetical protein Kapaf2KO_04690 [Candidatus Kapaibacteriales bacterium]
MDDYSVVMAVLLFLGQAVLFLSSLLANHERESPISENTIPKKYKPEKENSEAEQTASKYNDSSRYERLMLRYEDRVNPFSQLESLFYILASLFLGLQFAGRPLQGILVALASLVVLLLIRAVTYALATRLSEKLFDKLFPIIALISDISHPVSLLLNKIRMSIGGKSQEEDSRDEIETLVDSAKEEGSLEDSEYRLLKNIMSFSDVLVSDVMTPRTVVFSLPESTTVADCIAIKEIRNYSRIPIFSGSSLDEGVKGYVTARDILAAFAEGAIDKTLRDLSRKVHFVPDSLELSKALEQFLLGQRHMSIVVDEYGGVDGLITMEDVLETILGVEIVDEADTITDLRKLAKKTRDFRQKRKKFG